MATKGVEVTDARTRCITNSQLGLLCTSLNLFALLVDQECLWDLAISKTRGPGLGAK